MSVDYSKQIERGLRWLRKHGGLAGLKLDNVLDHMDDLDLVQPCNCVLGWASGGKTEDIRARAYHRVTANYDGPAADHWIGSTSWSVRHGFSASDFSAYNELTRQWKARLARVGSYDD